MTNREVGMLLDQLKGIGEEVSEENGQLDWDKLQNNELVKSVVAILNAKGIGHNELTKRGFVAASLVFGKLLTKK